MSPLTKCDGGHCPMKEDCQRYVSLPVDQWTPFYWCVPFDITTNECEQFVDKENNV